MPTSGPRKTSSLSVSRVAAALFFVLLQIFLLTPETMANQGLEPASVETGPVKYLGAEACKNCHSQIYESWRESGHAAIMRKPDQDTLDTIPLPPATKPEDISYIIGGYRWKALYLDQEGYFITSGPGRNRPNQYDVQLKKWSDYLPGERVRYTCGRCHTTGFSPDGNQGGLGGIQGTWKLDGVQCEACHGPGSGHVESQGEIKITASGAVCGNCHQRDPVDTIPLGGVFLLPYTEVNQLGQSGMAGLECTNCHNPHRPVTESVRTVCKSCHQDIWQVYTGSFKDQLGLDCVDCHMPPAGMVAKGNETIFEGDLKSHIFRIDHHADLSIAKSNGQRVNSGYLSVEYVCNRCHNLFEDREWAVRYGTNVHNIRTTTNLKVFRIQRLFMLVGFIFAILATVSGLGMKKIIPSKVNRKLLVDIHKHAAWTTFAAYAAVATTCIYFHTPVSTPLKLANTGWFVIHPVAGLTAIFLYGAKIWTVRVRRKGWKTPGTVWGLALSLFWLVQVVTVFTK